MAKLNVLRAPIHTHEGARATHINSELQLRRSVMACLLWEKQFYEDGIEIADRIAAMVGQVLASKVAAIAIEAREQMKLRHVPLLIVREMARLAPHKYHVADTLARVIQRPDELTEFLAIYWKDGRQPLSAQVKRGLAMAFPKFNAYQLAKYNREGQVKLRDVLFLCHAKPENEEQAQMWAKLVEGTLEAPDTWEVALSAGEGKKFSFERLLREKKLGALALLRNIRNMAEADVDEELIFSALDSMKTERVLPFRFIAAARYAPRWEPKLEEAMLRCMANETKKGGKTVILVDVSGSMKSQLSERSDMTLMDAACGLAILAREIYTDCAVWTFSERHCEVPARHGFALRDAIVGSQEHSSTYLGRAVDFINDHTSYDRIIVITDEQAHDHLSAPKGRGYVVNIASYRNGLGYGAWTHIDGFSEATLRYITEYEDALSQDQAHAE